MNDIVARMTQAYDAKHVTRLASTLRTATALQAKAIWREAEQLGVQDALSLAVRTGLTQSV